MILRLLATFLAVSTLCRNTIASPISADQAVLSLESLPHQQLHPSNPTKPAKLHGRFLQITDLHPDPYYKVHSSTHESAACHRGEGLAGMFGAETSDCDSPLSLINATFRWIEDNLADNIDFVVWTGDSARHDNDEEFPRSKEQVIELNEYAAEKFANVFGNGEDYDDPTKDLSIPVVPTFGNNDILPHNILLAGPNKWLTSYKSTWRKFIPEEQRHSFERGGWFYVEVIPDKLAVVSLNTLYFFDNNAAVDGCADPSEPGYEHMEWLRVQLQLMRDRGVKALLMGHVPPARTESKQMWNESCWQKYTLWLQQYRDVVVGALYGHMNVDHFFIQKTSDIDLMTLASDEVHSARKVFDEELTIQSTSEYLEELRHSWSKLPDPSAASTPSYEKEDETVLGKKDRKKLGPWGQNFQITLVSPSVVPNYFPTLRVIEYNISGLEHATTWREARRLSDETQLVETTGKKKKEKKKKPKDPNTSPGLIIPSPPSSSSPPGPAYSPQTLSLLGYTQYYANLTHINNDVSQSDEGDEPDMDNSRWRDGKHRGKHPENSKPKPQEFEYQVEYSTFNDTVYKLKDMTVLSYLKLAHRIGQYKPVDGQEVDLDIFEIEEIDDQTQLSETSYSADPIKESSDAHTEGKKDKKKKKKDKKKKKKKKKQREVNKVWLSFVQRAFVDTLDEEDLESF